jgi:hypothetical protein
MLSIKRKIRLLLFFLTLGLTLLFGGWGSSGAPRRSQEHALRLLTTETPQVVLGRWRVQLETPQYLRLGDAGLVRLSLLPLEESSSAPEGPSLPGDVVLPADAFGATTATRPTMIAEARLDLAGMEVRPDQEISEPLFPGQPLTFFWSVRAVQAGEYQGVAWLHLRLLTDGEETRLPLSCPGSTPAGADVVGAIGEHRALVEFAWGTLTFLLGFPYLKEVALWLQQKVQRQGGNRG